MNNIDICEKTTPLWEQKKHLIYGEFLKIRLQDSAERKRLKGQNKMTLEILGESPEMQDHQGDNIIEVRETYRSEPLFNQHGNYFDIEHRLRGAVLMFQISPV